jgi:hypothetical protein
MAHPYTYIQSGTQTKHGKASHHDDDIYTRNNNTNNNNNTYLLTELSPS